jgi:hypothetical protein
VMHFAQIFYSPKQPLYLEAKKYNPRMNIHNPELTRYELNPLDQHMIGIRPQEGDFFGIRVSPDTTVKRVETRTNQPEPTVHTEEHALLVIQLDLKDPRTNR